MKLPGLRWIPIPLAILTAVVGWLVFGALAGQSQAIVANQPGWVAGGLETTVSQMLWMSNDMTGQGPLKKNAGFPMDPNEMPGMQTPGDNRLQVDIDLENVSTHFQTYSYSEFRVLGPKGQSWPYTDTGGEGPISGIALQPGYDVHLSLYFDLPIAQTKGLSIEWTRGGATVDFPVSTTGVPTPHHH